MRQVCRVCWPVVLDFVDRISWCRNSTGWDVVFPWVGSPKVNYPQPRHPSGLHSPSCKKAPLPTRGKTTSHPVEFLHQLILSTKSNTTGQHTRHTCLIKPRRHSPPYHSNHQPNLLQHREPSHHRASDETCRRCNPIPVTPSPHFSHPPHLTPKCTHLHPTTPTIPFYGTIFCILLYISSPIYMYSVLYSIFLYLTSVIVSVGDPTMRSAFFV